MSSIYAFNTIMKFDQINLDLEDILPYFYILNYFFAWGSKLNISVMIFFCDTVVPLEVTIKVRDLFIHYLS